VPSQRNVKVNWVRPGMVVHESQQILEYERPRLIPGAHLSVYKYTYYMCTYMHANTRTFTQQRVHRIFPHTYFFATNYRTLLWKEIYKDKASMQTYGLWINGTIADPAHTYLTEWQRCIGCLILVGHFRQNNPIISDSFAEWDLKLKASYASSPPRTCQYDA